MKLGDKIKKIRDLKGLKQEEMAALLNISSQAYSKLERNETKMDDDRLEQIAKILDVSTDDIKNFDDKSLFINNLNEYDNSNQSTGTGHTVINHFYGNEAVPLLQKTIEQQLELIGQQKEEITFLRKQLEAILKNK
jgi:transcriptional regulator with XRE-family HTH domain